MNNFKILIPARGGSKRIPNKNIIPINGKPLISYAIDQALSITEEVYVSTDCDKISRVANDMGATTIERPSVISGDHSTTEEAVRHFLELEETDIIVVLQATTPLLGYEYILEGINLVKFNYDSVISVTEDRGFYWDSFGDPVNFIPGKRPRTQDMNPWYRENGAFYITRKDLFMESNLLYSGNVGFVSMDIKHSVDIDTMEEVELIKSIINKDIN